MSINNYKILLYHIVICVTINLRVVVSLSTKDKPAHHGNI